MSLIAVVVSVLTYNVMFDSTDVQASIAVIEKAKPDVVCLQELTPGFQTAFEKRLGATLPHRSMSAKSGTWGVGIASRFPLSHAKEFRQERYRMPAMEALVRTPDGPLLVSCLHLFPPFAKREPGNPIHTMRANAELRKQQAEHLVKRYAKESAPVVLMGDFNEEDGDAVKTVVEAGYADSCELDGAHCSSTWPGATTKFPSILRIDFVFGRSVNFETAKVIKGGGSDHYPVQSTFSLE